MKEGSNTLTWILGGALVVALIVIAFLLGRESQTATLGGPVAIIDRTAAPPPTAPDPGPARTKEVGEDVVITNTGGGEARIVRGGAPSPSHERRPPPRAEPSASSVSDYFEAIDRVQAGPQAMSPDAFAQGLASDISSGDASGLRRLEGDLAKAERELSDITPPSECAEYHRELLATVKESRDMLRAMTNAVGSGDTSGIASLASKAGQLQRRQQKLDRMRKKLSSLPRYWADTSATYVAASADGYRDDGRPPRCCRRSPIERG